MINANELRLGNWVETYTVMLSGSWIDKDGNVHGQDTITEPTIRQKQIDIKDLEIISKAGGLATYRGIPLTGEILEKCGFVKEVDSGSGKPYEYHITFGDNYTLIYYPDLPDWELAGMPLPVSPKYLHQLQNLYWCLVGEELNYKP